MIKAAYNFVPVSPNQKYYSPAWANEVSHDIPFSDGVSGEINLTLTANTAIFVKGPDGKFVNMNEQMYFIPGTTIKGCVRSVLEILSFGHLNEDRVKDEVFSFRDLSDMQGYMAKMLNNVRCGWLSINGERGVIFDCGKPGYIRHDDLSGINPSYTSNKFRNATNAIEKYKICGSSYITADFNSFTLPNKRAVDNRKFYQKATNEGKEGTVVFTGFFGRKKSEFIFFTSSDSKVVNVPSDVLSNFKKLYPEFSELPNNPPIPNGIPVFYTAEEGKAKTMGLNLLHKYYAKNSIRQAIPDKLKGNDMDMADVMFGSIKHNLKGRVQFGKAIMTEGELLQTGETINAVLGSPKASFYPTYLKSGTWDSDNLIISGRKRYPIKPRYDVSPFISNDNEKTQTQLYPIKEDAKFKCKVRFHNLKEVELGALLSAITFHGREATCKHSIGQAKALGYGSVSVEINSISTDNDKNSKEEYLEKFKTEMTKRVPNWENSEELKELFAMAEGFTDDSIIDIFTSMLLGMKEKVEIDPIADTCKYKSKSTTTPEVNSDQFREARIDVSKGRDSFRPFSKIKEDPRATSPTAVTPPAGQNQPRSNHDNRGNYSNRSGYHGTGGHGNRDNRNNSGGYENRDNRHNSGGYGNRDNQIEASVEPEIQQSREIARPVSQKEILAVVTLCDNRGGIQVKLKDSNDDKSKTLSYELHQRTKVKLLKKGDTVSVKQSSNDRTKLIFIKKKEQ